MGLVEGDLGLELWIGCDGGVYRSRATGPVHAGDPGSFLAVNTGLGVLEAGFLAGHPVSDALALTSRRVPAPLSPVVAYYMNRAMANFARPGIGIEEIAGVADRDLGDRSVLLQAPVL